MALKLKQLEVEQKLKSLGLAVFTPSEFKDIFGVSLTTARSYIKRNIVRGLFIKLRNSFYQLSDSNPSLYLIANRLYQPSYISLEKALSHHHIIPETVYAVTSISTKPTREFVNPRGAFSYQQIKKSAFTGYSSSQIEGTIVFMAEPAKALADYLYFVDLKKISLNDRLEISSIKKSEVVKYAKLFDRPGMLTLIEKIYVESTKPRTIR
jgi:predicted transcriptional regulator of viral defense system